MPTGEILLRDTFVPFFKNVIDILAEIGTTTFTFKIKVLKASITLCKTVLCLNISLSCCSDTLQALKKCAVTHTCIGRAWLQLLFSIF